MTPSLLIVPDRYKAAKLYSQLPESGAGDFTVTRGTTATRVNASGLIESVASGVPRIDYTGGGCGSLLVEPAATNLILRSEEFDDALWTKTRGTITANDTAAPNGSTTADLWAQNSGETTAAALLQTLSITSGTIYSLSVFAKKQNKNFLGIRANAVSSTPSYFDLQNGTLGSINPLHTARIENYGNGWYKCSITYTASSTGSLGHILYPTDGSSLTVTDSGGIFLWGAQLETGSVATSYIPTVATTQTRNADVISRTAVSGLIGQSEGTIYAEINLSKLTGSRYIIAIVVNATNYFAIRTNASNAFIFRYRNGGSETTIPSIPNVSNSSTGIFKLALAYQDGNYAAAVNGTVYSSTASGIFPSGTFETVDLSFTTPLNDRISAAAIYTSRLSNSELASLTTL